MCLNLEALGANEKSSVSPASYLLWLIEPMCWPAGGHASEGASNGGVWRWPLRRPLRWSLSFHGNGGPECNRLWGRSIENARNFPAQTNYEFILVFTTPEWSFFSLIGSWLWILQEWHRARVWRVWIIRRRLWLCRAGRSRDVGCRGNSQHELHQISSHNFKCKCQVICKNPHPSVSPPQVELRAEKGQKGEPAIIEPVRCKRHLMNSIVALVISMGKS